MTVEYHVTQKQLSQIKRAADHMGLSWQSIAARPASAARLCEAIDQWGIASGCQEWSESLPLVTMLKGSSFCGKKTTASEDLHQMALKAVEDACPGRDHMNGIQSHAYDSGSCLFCKQPEAK